MIETDELYDLLPAVYRLRDDDRDHVLRALVDILAEQASVVDDDVAGLYDNWFIETCAPWVVPYIGDLLDVRGLYPVGPGAASQRAYVANTLGYRRRKGTLGVVEQLAFDVTGWRAKAVEFFQLLGTTQYVKHLRPANLRTPDLRDTDALELLGGPFEQATHTAEVRRLPSRRGRYNIPNVGLYLWRLQSYPIAHGTARGVGAPADQRFTFSPLGLDAPLFNVPQTESGIADLATELDVPAPLRRRALRAHPDAYFDPVRPALRVFVRDTPDPAPFAEVPAKNIVVADLSLWQRPPAPPPNQLAVAVDPELGRMTFPAGASIDRVEVSHAYGLSDDLGGGPYDRRRNVNVDFVRRVDWQAAVGQRAAPVADEVFTTLGDAVAKWNAQPAGSVGVIAILDSRTYEEDLTGAGNRIELKEGSELLIVAADWPDPHVLGQFVPENRRPHLLGKVDVIGTAGAANEVPGRLTIDGLLVEGPLQVLAGNLGGLHLADSTLVPAAGGLEASSTAGKRNATLHVELSRTICGPVTLAASIPELDVADCICGAIDAEGSAARVETSTILGETSVRMLHASDSIFTDAVVAARRQEGCVRFSYVPSIPVTKTPRRYHCQPDLALKGVKGPTAQGNVRARVVPAFTSLVYGDPGYVQLGRTCPTEIQAGADDGSEMGAFSSLRQPQREANLRAALDEYLRFGLEAGAFFVT